MAAREKSGLATRLYARARTFARQHRALYAVVRLIKYGPFIGLRNQKKRRSLIEEARRCGWRALYLGSGGRRQLAMINLDITPVTGPDVVGDGYRLPFRDGTFDAIFCEYVIEHVSDPERFLLSASRALKPGGIFYLEVPFLQPTHGGDFDFTRWTLAGFTNAVQRAGLGVLETGVNSGPAFAMFWILREWTALLLSFGISGLREVLSYLLGWLLAPLMVLDLIMLHLPSAGKLASGYYVVASPRSLEAPSEPGGESVRPMAS
jgi:SAM-dependent methyltransferase